MYRANKNISNYIKIVIQVLQYFFVLLFVYAAVSKLLDIETFRVQLAQSPLLSAYAGILAWAVPVAELVIAGLLCFEPTKKLGLSGFFFMMVMFSAYIFFILKFADFVPCSCGGVLEKMSWGQHLVFNLVFVALSGIILYFGMQGKRRRRWMALGAQFILGIGVVGVLFAFSERKMQRNNAFQRRYLPHVVEKVGEFDLGVNSYYIAGMDDRNIYLGNVTAPFLINTITLNLEEKGEYLITIDNTEILFKRVRIAVQAPYFYFSDGTVPVIFRGKTGEWKANTYSYNDAFFSHLVVADTSLLGIQTLSSSTKTPALGTLYTNKDKNLLFINNGILKIDGEDNFSADGMLLWNKEYRQFIFIYYYRNVFEVITDDLEYGYSGKTIDTVYTPQLDVAYDAIKGVYKRGESLFINNLSSTSGKHLYIHSRRLGKFEDEKALKSASIIDVYNVINKEYAFSFYLYHQANKNLREFKVQDGLIIALVDNTLWLYDLKSSYFP